VRFRRGFHDNGFAKTILLVEPTEPFLGTVRLDALPYENVDLKRYYPQFGVSRLSGLMPQMQRSAAPLRLAAVTDQNRFSLKIRQRAHHRSNTGP
jgi:hypothetical protein